MILVIKRSARIIGFITFFAVLFFSLNPDDPLATMPLIIALTKAFGAALVFWLTGYIVGDIIFKGLVETINPAQVDRLEGGLIQRVVEEKQSREPVMRKKREQIKTADEAGGEQN
jgi:hypothetical protein